MSVADRHRAEGAAPRLRWWKEAAIVSVFYAMYSAIRNRFGSFHLDDGGLPLAQFRHAMQVVRVERAFGLYHERDIQLLFLAHHRFLQFWNVFYGTAHFAVTIFTFVCLYRFSSARFVRWRNTLACTTALALVGFSLFPLMPPRLLSSPRPYGGASLAATAHTPARLDFTDTLEVDGGLWSFDSGSMTRISNQYAAMPSLHMAWSTWCVLALWPLAARHRHRRWLRWLAVVYPFATLFGIIITANHFWLDAAGGLAILGCGWWLGNRLEDFNQRRLVSSRRLGLARRDVLTPQNEGQ